MPNQKNIFISYSRKDKEVVDEVVEALENAGLKCWVDLKDLKGGDEWLKKIANKIDSADYFVPFLSANSIESENVYNEIAYALNTDIEDRKDDFCVIPIKLDDSKLPKEIILGLGRYQQINFEGDSKDLCIQVVRAISPDDAPEIDYLLPSLKQSLFNVELLALKENNNELSIDAAQILDEAESIFADTIKNSKYVNDVDKPRYNIAIAASYLYYSNYLNTINQKKSDILGSASTIIFMDNIKKEDSSLYDYISKKSYFLSNIISKTDENLMLQFLLARYSLMMSSKCIKKSKSEKDFINYEKISSAYLNYFLKLLIMCRYIKSLNQNPDLIDNVGNVDLSVNKWLYPDICDDNVVDDLSNYMSSLNDLFSEVYFQSRESVSDVVCWCFDILLLIDGICFKLVNSEKSVFFINKALILIGSIELIIKHFYGVNSDEMFIVKQIEYMLHGIADDNQIKFSNSLLCITSSHVSQKNWLKRYCLLVFLPILVRFHSSTNNFQINLFLDSLLALTKEMSKCSPRTLDWIYFFDRKLLNIELYNNKFSYKVLCLYRNVESLFQQCVDLDSWFFRIGLLAAYSMMTEYINCSSISDAEFCCYRICKYISNNNSSDNKEYLWLLNKVGYILKWMNYEIESLTWFPLNSVGVLDDVSVLTKIFIALVDLSLKANNFIINDVEVVSRIFADWELIFSCDEVDWYYFVVDDPINLFMTKMSVIFAYFQSIFPDIVISSDDKKNTRIKNILNIKMYDDKINKMVSILTIKTLPKYWICHNVSPFDFETVESWNECLKEEI